MADKDNEILVLTDEGDCVGLHVRNDYANTTDVVSTLWQSELLQPGLLKGLCFWLADMDRDQSDGVLAKVMQMVDAIREQANEDRYDC